MSFKAEQIARLAESGWSCCESVAEAVAQAGLPAVTPDYLATAFSDDLWEAAERAVLALRNHFASARFADETTYGTLLVPDPGKLDTRRPMTAAVRADQLGTAVTCLTANQTRGGRSRCFPARASPMARPSPAPYSRARCVFVSAGPTAASDPRAWLPPSPSPRGTAQGRWSTW